MKKSKLLLILCMVIVLALGVLVSCDKKGETCAHESYGAWQITKAPTTTETGTAIRVCTNGDNVETVTLAKLSDTSVWTASASTATHEAAGEITYTSTYGSVKVAVDRLDGHVYDKEVAEPQFLVSAADCTNAAVYRKSCVCGAVGTATFNSGNPVGHQIHPVQAQAAVHTSTSLVNAVAAHHKCDACGKLFTDAAGEHETTLAALTTVTAHTYGGWTLVSEPTCTVDGSITRTCSVSGCGHVDTQVIPAHDHVYTKGIIVPYDPNDNGSIWDGDYADGEDYDVPDSTQHARVCDICGVVDKKNAVAHDYTGAEEIFVIDDYYKTISSTVKCIVCGHAGEGPTKVNGDINGYEIVAEESVSPTYTEAGYTTYQQKNGTLKFKVIEPKLVAPYDGKEYKYALEIGLSDGVNSGSVSAYCRESKLTLNNIGIGKGTSYPFSGDVTVTMVNASTGKISLVVGTSTYVGYVEPSTGIMVVSDDNFATIQLVTPYEATMYSAVASCWNNAMAISYHIDCGTYTGHDINILVHNGVVTFGVSFETEQGKAVAANECFSQDTLIVTAADGSVVATFVKNGDGMLQIADEYRGEYKAVMDIDGATNVEVGTLVVDGIGGFVLNDDDGNPQGTYTAVYNGGELVRFDAYVMVNGKKVEYHHAIIVADAETKTIKLVPQTITITLNAGDHGTVENDTVTAYVNCVLPAISKPTANPGDTFVFVGWYNEDTLITDDTILTQDVTLVARWADKVTVTIHDGDSTEEKTLAVTSPVISVLPERVKNTTVNADNTKYFAGWFLDEACTADKELDDNEMLPDGDVDVYAKWVDITWTIANSTVNNVYPFEYDSARGVWQSTCQGVNNGVSAMRIIANGPITVSFKYAASAEGSSFDLIYVELLASLDSATGTEKGKDGNKVDFDKIVWKEMELKLSAGQILQFRYKKDNSGNHNEDRGFVKDLTINGKAMSTLGTMPDGYDGTYTCSEQNNLVLDGCGRFTWGDKTGNYTISAENKLDMFIVEDGAVAEYYSVSLDAANSAYTADKVMVNVSFAFGDVPTTLTPANVNAKIVYTLPEAPVVDGYVFRGWYDNAELTGNAITSITPSADITVHAKYDVAVTITYNYGVAGVEDKVVTGKGVGDKIGTLEPIGEVTNGNLVFAGWFLKDGETWGDEVTADTVLTASITAYAKWIEPNVLFGTWKGASPSYNGFGSMVTLTIDAFGKVTTSDSKFKNGSVRVSETNAVTIYIPERQEEGWYGDTTIIPAKSYAVSYDEVNGCIVVIAESSTYVFAKVEDSSVSVKFNGSFIVNWDGGLVDDITIGTGDSAVTKRFALIGNTTLVWNPTITAADKEGVVVADGTSYKVKGTQVTVTYNETTVSVVYSGSSFVTADSYRGVYTDAALGKVVLDGAGNIWIGTENTITGTYTEVTSGKVSTTISKVYYDVTLNAEDHTCVVSIPKAPVTYVVENGSIDGETTVEIGLNVEFTLPSVTPSTGYQFVGWYLTTDIEFANKLTKYTLTSTDAISFTAKLVEVPKWASAETTESAITFTDDVAVFAGETNAMNQVYYIKLVAESDGDYAIIASSSKVGGAGKANYGRYSVINSDGTGVKTSMSFGTSSTNISYFSLTAGTYYIQVALGGQVVGSSGNQDVYGTFEVKLATNLHNTADKALTYTVGETVTSPNYQMSVSTVYTVQLEAGKTYKISYTTSGNAWMPISIYSSNTLTGATVAKPGGSWTAGDVKEQDFTVSTSGIYYMVIADYVPFSIVEVTA